ncbi:hypothetical protein DFS34DRAFT_599626 [Phlyctochytrium arcticum]|nr:hypothetical protein DFS34DRAFT_599626 [Phlyctochytrium arcticum]
MSRERTRSVAGSERGRRRSRSGSRDRSKSRSKDRQRRTDPQEDVRSLFIRGLSDDTRSQDLLEAFQKYGTVTDCYLPRDFYTGNSRGFAYIQYATQDEADRAFSKIEYITIGGKTVTVEWAAGRRKTPGEMRGRGNGPRQSQCRPRNRSRSRSRQRRYRSRSRSYDRSRRRYSQSRSRSPRRSRRDDASPNRKYSRRDDAPPNRRASRQSTSRSPPR